MMNFELRDVTAEKTKELPMKGSRHLPFRAIHRVQQNLEINLFDSM